MAKTTNEITDAQIRALSREAEEYGDPEQVEVCERALDGDAEARAECARVIADAQANRLTARVLHGLMCVEDSEGGIWSPSPAAAEEIEAAEDPKAAAIRMASDEPMRGTWVQ